MGVELRPLGVKCNLRCHYCYQEPQRDAGNIPASYSMSMMKAALEQENSPFVLFGGEPLLVPIEDLEELWRYGLERFGENGVQTNGSLITEKHLELFKRYKVRVGISVDGPGELNGLRWQGTEERTIQATRKTHEAIELLCREGIPPNLIITLHRQNAGMERLDELLTWVAEVSGKGVRSIRLHLLESESAELRERFGLSERENIAALLAFLKLESSVPALRIDLFTDMRRLLMGDDSVTTCVWYGCDPYTTKAVRGVEGHGQRSNCGRTNKDGVDFVKSNRPGFERYIALYQTPQEYAGCQGCRFFLMCKGQCPGTAVGNDWRNRTEHCGVWMRIFEELELRLKGHGEAVLTAHPSREWLEAQALEGWACGKPFSMSSTLKVLSEQKLVEVTSRYDDHSIQG